MNYKDNMDGTCKLFIRVLRRDYRSRQAEINPHTLVKYTRRFQAAYGVKHEQLLDALIRRGWFEPSAADTFTIRFDLVER